MQQKWIEMIIKTSPVCANFVQGCHGFRDSVRFQFDLQVPFLAGGGQVIFGGNEIMTTGHDFCSRSGSLIREFLRALCL